MADKTYCKLEKQLTSTFNISYNAKTKTYKKEENMQSLPMIEARDRLTSLPEELEQDKELGAIAITRQGKPVLAVMSWELYESLVETLEIMSDPEAMAAFHQGVKEMKEGKSIPLEEVKRQLGLE